MAAKERKRKKKERKDCMCQRVLHMQWTWTANMHVPTTPVHIIARCFQKKLLLTAFRGNGPQQCSIVQVVPLHLPSFRNRPGRSLS